MDAASSPIESFIIKNAAQEKSSSDACLKFAKSLLQRGPREMSPDLVPGILRYGLLITAKKRVAPAPVPSEQKLIASQFEQLMREEITSDKKRPDMERVRQFLLDAIKTYSSQPSPPKSSFLCQLCDSMGNLSLVLGAPQKPWPMMATKVVKDLCMDKAKFYNAKEEDVESLKRWFLKQRKPASSSSSSSSSSVSMPVASASSASSSSSSLLF